MDFTGIQMDEPKEYPQAAINRRARFCGKTWSHLWCEDGLEERLHEVAKLLGLQRGWFQNRDGFPHYDLTVGKYWQAHRLGVPTVSLLDWVRARRAKAAE